VGATPAEGGSGTCLKGGTVMYPEVKLKDEDRDKRRGEIGMTGSERRYLKTHPWLTFKFDMSGIRADTWILLGEATSKCEHLARSVMPPAFAQELNKIYVERGALGTTAIEGNTLTEREVREIMEGRDRVPPSRAYQKQEIENVISLFNDVVNECVTTDSAPFSARRLKDFHATLLKGQPLKEGVVPGEFRTHSVTVGSYAGAPAEDCEYLVDYLCQWLNDELAAAQADKTVMRTPRIFVLAVLAHLYLAWIHPFGDGNGRMARLLEFDLLLRAGVPLPAAHLLSDHYNKTRDMYYAVLAEASRRPPHYQAEKVIRYAIEGLVDGLREQIGRVTALHESVMWQSYVTDAFRSMPQTKARLRQRDVALALPPGKWTTLGEVLILTPEVAEQYRGLTSKAVSRDLNELAKLNLVERKRGLGVRPLSEIMTSFRPPRVEF